MKTKFIFATVLLLVAGLLGCDNKFAWIEPPPPLPIVTKIAPDNGVAGTEVTVTGVHFSPTLLDNSVTINGTSATIVDATATTIVFIAPTETTGAVVVTVGGQTAENMPVFTYK